MIRRVVETFQDVLSTTSQCLGNSLRIAGKTGTGIALLAVLSGCVGDSDSGDADSGDGAETSRVTEEFDFTQMLANYADNLIVPRYQNFQALALLASNDGGAFDNYCDSIGSVSEANARTEAQRSWRQMMSQWQQTELFIVGPAADNSNARRNAILSYASNFPPSTCAVDQSVVLAQEATFEINSRSFNARGLDALEYLLFNDNLNHTCPVQIVQTQTWNDLDDSVRRRQRCDYAKLVGQDIAEAAGNLTSGWAVTGGNFRTAFVNPANSQTNLENLSDALFYIELETKDTKLGVTTGLNDGCNQVACPAATESPYSETTLMNIRENLVGFRDALNGGGGLGFDDIIIAEGFSGVVDDFNNNIDLAIDLIDTTDSSLLSQSQALLDSGDSTSCENSASNPESVQSVPICSLHGIIKRITDSLRIDFVTIVNLDLPDRGQSDND